MLIKAFYAKGYKPILYATLLVITLFGSVQCYSGSQLLNSSTDIGCSSQQKSKGLSVVSIPPISNIPILPDTDIGRLKQASCEVSMVASAGEYEPASLVINAVDNSVAKATVSISDLVGASGTIGASNIDVKVVKVWYQSYGAWFEVGRPTALQDRPILVPELLLNDETLVTVDTANKTDFVRQTSKTGDQFVFKGSTAKVEQSVINLSPDYTIQDSAKFKAINLEKNKNKQLWLTVHVPVDAMPGRYDGSLQIKANAAVLADIKIHINVLPFVLKEPRLEYGIYYHGRIHKSLKESISSEYKSPKQLRAELSDMLEHGIKNPIIYHPLFDTDNTDPSGLKQYLTIRKQLGIDNTKLYLMYLNTDGLKTAEELKQLENAIAIYKTLFTPFGTKEIYVYGRDEARGQDLIDQRPAWQLVHKMGAKVYAAGFKGTYESVGDLLDLFVSAYAPMVDEARKFHSTNRKIFSYGNPQSGVESPYIYRKNYGVVLWASEYDGAMLYAYQHSMGDGWDDFDNVFRDHNFTYPTSDGVIKTIAWEGLREGIDDVRYITTLENLINTPAIASNPANKATLNNANAYLTKLKNDLNSLNKYDTFTDATVFIDLDSVRNQVVDFIIALQGK